MARLATSTTAMRARPAPHLYSGGTELTRVLKDAAKLPTLSISWVPCGSLELLSPESSRVKEAIIPSGKGGISC